MNSLVRIEMKRAFTGSGMKISLGIGCILALSHFVLRIVPLNILEGYSQYVASSNPRNLLAGWMAGTPSMENEIYRYIVYLLAVIPYGASYYSDMKSGVVKNFCVRIDKKNYIISKSLAVFCSGGVSALFPLLLNIMLCSLMLPVVFPEWESGPHPNGAFSALYYQNYMLYYLLLFLLIFVFAGLIAGLALTISLFAKNSFLVLTFPFIICVLISKLCSRANSEIIRGFTISEIFDVVQVDPKCPKGIILMGILLFMAGYFFFIMKGVTDDTIC